MQRSKTSSYPVCRDYPRKRVDFQHLLTIFTGNVREFFIRYLRDDIMSSNRSRAKSRDVGPRPWTIDGAAATYETSVKNETKRLAREAGSSIVERANNARAIASSGRALGLEFFGGKLRD